jgi:hypothetical protein
MARWAVGLGLLGWWVLCSAGCRRPEPEVTAPAPTGPTRSTTATAEAPPVRAREFVDLSELTVPVSTTTGQPEPPAPPVPPTRASETDAEQPPSRPLLTDSGSWEWPERKSLRPSAEDEDRAFLRAAAEAARAGNTRISATRRLEEVTIATGTVDGRVKRVRPGTLEVSDDEGNVYELRIDGRTRGLRRGRHIPLEHLTEGLPVRATFDFVGDGESLARDIELRR